MKRSEVAMLLTMAKAIDDRVVIDEGRVISWEASLDADMPYEFAKQAMTRHYAERDIPVMPSHLNDPWKIEKRDRADRERSRLMLEERKALEAAAADPRPYLAQIRERLTGVPEETRKEILAVACPYCRAKAGDKCIDGDGQHLKQTTFAHPSRWDVAREHATKESA